MCSQGKLMTCAWRERDRDRVTKLWQVLRETSVTAGWLKKSSNSFTDLCQCGAGRRQSCTPSLAGSRKWPKVKRRKPLVLQFPVVTSFRKIERAKQWFFHFQSSLWDIFYYILYRLGLEIKLLSNRQQQPTPIRRLWERSTLTFHFTSFSPRIKSALCFTSVCNPSFNLQRHWELRGLRESFHRI